MKSGTVVIIVLLVVIITGGAAFLLLKRKAPAVIKDASTTGGNTGAVLPKTYLPNPNYPGGLPGGGMWGTNPTLEAIKLQNEQALRLAQQQQTNALITGGAGLLSDILDKFSFGSDTPDPALEGYTDTSI